MHECPRARRTSWAQRTLQQRATMAGRAAKVGSRTVPSALRHGRGTPRAAPGPARAPPALRASVRNRLNQENQAAPCGQSRRSLSPLPRPPASSRSARQRARTALGAARGGCRRARGGWASAGGSLLAASYRCAARRTHRRPQPTSCESVSSPVEPRSSGTTEVFARRPGRRARGTTAVGIDRALGPGRAYRSSVQRHAQQRLL